MGRVTQSASASNSCMDVIQQTITAILDFNEFASTEMEKLRNENASLTTAIKALFDDVKKGERKRGKDTQRGPGAQLKLVVDPSTKPSAFSSGVSPSSSSAPRTQIHKNVAKKAEVAQYFMISHMLAQGYTMDDISNPELVQKFTKEQADQARIIKEINAWTERMRIFCQGNIQA